ncbi:glycosyltransferase family 39 protein [bacterium]|nr:glycosyltransferase family 39 protein [bacterium]
MKFLLLLITLCIFILPQLSTSSLGRLYDAPRYICLGYSIANGNGYRFVFDPHNKPCFYNNFLFPYILAPVIKLKGIDFFSLKLAMIILSIIAIILFIKWSERFYEKEKAVYPSLLFLSSALFIEFSDKVMTEVPFLVFLLLSFLLFQAWIKSRKNIHIVALALSTYCLIFTRIPGIAFLLGVIIYAMAKKDKKLLGMGIIVFITVLITIGIIQGRVNPQDKFYHLRYLLYKNPFAPEAGYVSPEDMITRIIQNFKFYIINIGKICIQFPHKSVLLSLLTLLIILNGIFKLHPSSRAFYLSSFIIYFFYFLIWPWQDTRFLLPLLPLLIVMFFRGLNPLLNKLSPEWRKATLTGILLLSFYGGYDKLVRKLTIENVYPTGLREFIEMGEWIGKAEKGDAVILSSNPSLIYLLSFKKGVFLIYTTDTEKINTYLKNNRVNYILTDCYNSEMKNYIYPWIYENRERLKIEKINGATVLFRID